MYSASESQTIAADPDKMKHSAHALTKKWHS